MTKNKNRWPAPSKEEPPPATVGFRRQYAGDAEPAGSEGAYETPFESCYTFENVSGTPSGARIEGLPSRSMEYEPAPQPIPPDRSMEGGERWYATGPKNTAKPGERFRGANPSSNARRKRSTG